MNTVIQALRANGRVTGYKINEERKESRELFFVKGKLETSRATDTKDVQVTVYVDHDGYKGDASFKVYPSTTAGDLVRLVDEAVEKALLINNEMYDLPRGETGTFEVESNFAGRSLADLAEVISRTVFSAAGPEDSALNAVEVFVNRRVERVVNSRGLDKTQTRYAAMVEAIPTFNGPDQSVELYQQLNFSALDEAALAADISAKLNEVKARYEAVKPGAIPPCAVILNKEELATLFRAMAGQLNYSRVYNKSALFKKGDAIQTDPTGDKITITMTGELPGSPASARFDEDGLSLSPAAVVTDGVAANYYGSSRYAQYLGEAPTGQLRCMRVEPGSACERCLSRAPYLEVVSMSGLQVSFNSDYIGGEVRLAYRNDGEKLTPVTGISIAGKLSQVLSSLRLSKAVTVHDGYAGPAKAILTGMSIF